MDDDNKEPIENRPEDHEPPPYRTAAAGPDDRLNPFKPSEEDHATGRAAAIDRFGLPAIPAAPPAPSAPTIPAQSVPAGSTVIPPAAGAVAPTPATVVGEGRDSAPQSNR